jgi:hypothetical protein
MLCLPRRTDLADRPRCAFDDLAGQGHGRGRGHWSLCKKASYSLLHATRSWAPGASSAAVFHARTRSFMDPVICLPVQVFMVVHAVMASAHTRPRPFATSVQHPHPSHTQMMDVAPAQKRARGACTVQVSHNGIRGGTRRPLF